MGVNIDKPHRWKADTAASVDMFNTWFMAFAPKTFMLTREQTAGQVEATLKQTNMFRDLSPNIMKLQPDALACLRMSTCPPLAKDRLIGLAGVSKNLVERMEKDNKVPPKMSKMELDSQLSKIGNIIGKMADPYIFPWIGEKREPKEIELFRASTIIADRLCGSLADPIIRNEQEKRQLSKIKMWLEDRGYQQLDPEQKISHPREMPKGTFSFRMNIVVGEEEGKVNIPVDAIIMPLHAKEGQLPVFIEAKSAGDFTNTNKRRKEEAKKIAQLKETYGNDVQFNLFLCGYFDGGYLGYEAQEGIDWVWEHRIDDLEGFNL